MGAFVSGLIVIGAYQDWRINGDPPLSFESIAFPAVFLITLTAGLLLVTIDWRMGIGALAVQYTGVFVLVAMSWPIEMAVVKLVSGWMAGAVLGIAILGLPEEAQKETPRSVTTAPFRFLAAVLVIPMVATFAPDVVVWVPGVFDGQVYGSLVLIGLGLLHLGLTTQPFRMVLGLLTVMAGFEILYAAVESSTLMAGLLALVNLSLALVGAYLIAAPTQEETS